MPHFRENFGFCQKNCANICVEQNFVAKIYLKKYLKDVKIVNVDNEHRKVHARFKLYHTYACPPLSPPPPHEQP
jgi:hypothetical protein